jgi:hypothetical protein
MERAATRALMAVAVAGALAVGSGADLTAPAGRSVPEGREADVPRVARSRAVGDTIGGGSDTTLQDGSTAAADGAAAGGPAPGGDSCERWVGAGCRPVLPVPPPPSSGPADGIGDYPGRYQVDPATGQVIDTGNASIPTEPITVETVPTTAPPPPVFEPEPTPTTTPPTAPPPPP